MSAFLTGDSCLLSVDFDKSAKTSGDELNNYSVVEEVMCAQKPKKSEH